MPSLRAAVTNAAASVSSWAYSVWNRISWTSGLMARRLITGTPMKRGDDISVQLDIPRNFSLFDRESAAAQRHSFWTLVIRWYQEAQQRLIASATNGKWIKWDTAHPPAFLTLGEGSHEKTDRWIRPSDSVLVSVSCSGVCKSRLGRRPEARICRRQTRAHQHCHPETSSRNGTMP